MTRPLPRLVHSEPAPVDERTKVLNEARDAMRARVAGLNPASKDGKRSKRLLTALDCVRDKTSNEEEQLLRAVRVVNLRVAGFKDITTGHLDSDQERDAMMLILFVDSRMSLLQRAREQACALLVQRGSDQAKTKICALFPGLRKVFD
ncbi:MAG: hypothetical protein RLZZ342_673 [Candidatus Parcubacteria bacterium]